MKVPCSNINKVIRAVLNFLFFYEKLLHAQKSTKTQKRNQTKAQNANEQTKIKNVLKNINNKGEKWENSNLFANLRFCTCEEKK